MEHTSLKRTLKGLMGAVIVNMIVELWIFIEIVYNIQWIFYVFITVCMIITVTFTKEKNIIKCLLNLNCGREMALRWWLYIFIQ